MTQTVTTYQYQHRDVWLSILVCYSIQILVGFLLIPALLKILPALSELTLFLCLPVLSAMIPIIYLGYRYGWLHLSDFLLRGSDYLVVLAAIFILFIRFAWVTFRSPFGISTVHSGAISQLPPFEYYLVLFAMFFYGPFLEELLLRKYVFEIFRNKLNIFSAIMLTALCGTILHIDFDQSMVALLKIFIYSAFYTLVYWKSRLGASIFIHGLTNFFIYSIWWR
jgi:membrane protease YdiL (CAAX protease family)